MLRRKAYNNLMEWKSRSGHKPLVVYGQRQVGKTYIIEQFAKDNYKSFVSINFSTNREIHKVFESDISVDHVINGLRIFYDDVDFQSPSLLLFFDEIQDCPRARESLKQFREDGRYDVIASGSYLGLSESRAADNKGLPALVPMGSEEHLKMTSLDFEEFLWATGFPEDILLEIKGKLRSKKPVGEPFYSKLASRFRDFMIVGGMPESVAAFVESKSYSESMKVLQSILIVCHNDINRYNRGIESVKTSECFDSIPSQLADSNKKFMYSRVTTDLGTRNSANKYMENLLWIKDAGYGNFCYALKEPKPILSAHIDRESFKVYISDTGLLTNMYGSEAVKALAFGSEGINQGALMENVVAECLMKAGIQPMYYRKTNGDNKMEVDFVLEKELKVIIIEVKSGRTRDSPSLKKVGKVFDIHRRLMLEDSDVHSSDDGVEHYPLFASAFINDLLG